MTSLRFGETRGEILQAIVDGHNQTRLISEYLGIGLTGVGAQLGKLVRSGLIELAYMERGGKGRAPRTYVLTKAGKAMLLTGNNIHKVPAAVLDRLQVLEAQVHELTLGLEAMNAGK